MSSSPDIVNTYAYNYYTLGGTVNCPCSLSYPTGLSAAYAPFNGPDYGRPAPLASLRRPAETLMLNDGPQLSRPPAAVRNVLGNDPNLTGVWGSHSIGNGITAPAVTTITAADRKQLLTGTLTNVVYCDGHVKTVQTTSLEPSTITMNNGAWKGTAVGDSTPAGNAGWARDW